MYKIEKLKRDIPNELPLYVKNMKELLKELEIWSRWRGIYFEKPFIKVEIETREANGYKIVYTDKEINCKVTRC